MAKQIYNSAWKYNTENTMETSIAKGSVSYIQVPIVRSTLKSLKGMLPYKEMLLDVLIMLPLIVALLIVMLNF